MEVTLLGAGDSTGTPAAGCGCETCRAAKDRGISRTRFSVHVRNPDTDQSLLIDASPDFRTQFLDHDVPLPDAAVITHIHFDHLDGLGNAYRVFRHLPVHASDRVDPATGESVATTIRKRYDYLDAVQVEELPPYETREVCGLGVELVPVEHPPVDCYGVVVTHPSGGKLAISGDTNWSIPERSLERFHEPDLFLVDALVPAAFCENHPAGGAHETPDGTPKTFGSKHLTREGALALADLVDATEARLVHLSHFYPPSEAFAEPLAVDGERYEL